MRMDTRKRTPEYVCRRKKRYATYDKAFQGARAQRGRVRLFVYECPVCEGWHVTKQHPESRRLWEES